MNETLAATLPEWPKIEPLFRKWRAFMAENVEFWPGGGELHTKAHCERVLLHALVIGARLKLPASDLEALATCAVFHDSRRLDDWYDVGHGQRAADYYREACAQATRNTNDSTVSESNGNGMSSKDSSTDRKNPQFLTYDWLVASIIAYHDQDDADGETVIATESPKEANPQSAILLYRIFKDADALDRWRLGSHGLDPAFLRTEPARQLVDFARELAGGETEPHPQDG